MLASRCLSIAVCLLALLPLLFGCEQAAPWGQQTAGEVRPTIGQSARTFAQARISPMGETDRTLWQHSVVDGVIRFRLIYFGPDERIRAIARVQLDDTAAARPDWRGAVPPLRAVAQFELAGVVHPLSPPGPVGQMRGLLEQVLLIADDERAGMSHRVVAAAIIRWLEQIPGERVSDVDRESVADELSIIRVPSPSAITLRTTAGDDNRPMYVASLSGSAEWSEVLAKTRERLAAPPREREPQTTPLRRPTTQPPLDPPSQELPDDRAAPPSPIDRDRETTRETLPDDEADADDRAVDPPVLVPPSRREPTPDDRAPRPSDRSTVRESPF